MSSDTQCRDAAVKLLARMLAAVISGDNEAWHESYQNALCRPTDPPELRKLIDDELCRS